jgi:Flp pilus assembly protein TadG
VTKGDEGTLVFKQPFHTLEKSTSYLGQRGQGRAIDESLNKMTDDTQQSIATARVPRKRSRSRGQSMVEFALVLPLMLGFLVIAADFGRAYTAYLTISSAAREGATYASRSSANAIDNTEIKKRVRAEVASDGKIWGQPLVVNVSVDKDTQGYNRVKVTVDYTFKPLFAIWPIPGDVPMQRSVQMRVLGN